MFSDLNTRLPDARNSLRIYATANFSNVMPLYLKNPAAANGAASKTHNHDTNSLPIISRSPKYVPTATPTASTEHMNCLALSPKNILS